MISRRAFLKNSSIALFGVGLGGIPSFVAKAANSQKVGRLYKRNKILVCIFQRGAMDGLSAVVPFSDQQLKALRPTLFMTPARNQKEGSLIDLDGTFGLHPSLSAFEDLFREQRLAVVHGIGSPNTTRSHFDAQDYMETGTPFTKKTESGWLNRAVGLLDENGKTVKAVSLTPSMPRILHGSNNVIAFKNISDFRIKDVKSDLNTAAQSFEELYDQTSSALLNKTGQESFEVMKVLRSADLNNYKPANGATYPRSDLGNALKQIALLIKMDVGVEVAFAESDNWDTHINQGAYSGNFARNAQDFSRSIAAFWTDLEKFHDDVTILTMTEFGRTVKQNGSEGTDHGRASCSFVIGNDVRGGLVHGRLHTLAPENLEDGRDLPVTTDFRAVFNEVCEKHLLIKDTSLLFPDWKRESIKIMKG